MLLDVAAAGALLHSAQYRFVGGPRRHDETEVRQIGDADKAGMAILAIEAASGQRLVEIGKPMGAATIAS